MAIDAAANVGSFGADISGIRTTIPPPLRRAENADDRSSGGHRKMRRAGIPADIHAGTFCQLAETLKARLSKQCFA